MLALCRRHYRRGHRFFSLPETKKTFEVDRHGVTLTCGPNVTLIFCICCFLKSFPKFLHTKRLNSVSGVAKYFAPVILFGSFKIAGEMRPSGTAPLEVEAVAGHPRPSSLVPVLCCRFSCGFSSGPDADVQPPEPPKSMSSFTRTGIFCSRLQVPAVLIPFPKMKFVLYGSSSIQWGQSLPASRGCCEDSALAGCLARRKRLRDVSRSAVQWKIHVSGQQREAGRVKAAVLLKVRLCTGWTSTH